MADMLLSLPVSAPVRSGYFDSFRSVGIQIPLEPVRIPKPVPQRSRKGLAGAFNLYQEQSSRFAEVASHYGKANQISPGDAGNAYTRLLLQDYLGGADGDAYVTTRLEGKRNPSPQGGPADVHIYEVLWADLARPDNTLLAFFLALFQLIIHLGSLSRLAIDTGAGENTGALWKIYLKVHTYAVRMLQIFIPLFKVLFLIAMFSCVPAVVKQTSEHVWFPMVLGGLGFTTIAFLLLRASHRAVRVHPWIWALLSIAPGAIGAYLGKFASAHDSPSIAGSLECWIFLGAALLYFVLKQYDQVRPGIRNTGWAAYTLFFVIFVLLYAFGATGGHRVQQATFWTAEWIIAALRFSWILLLVFAFCALGLGSVAWRSQVKDSAQRARARAAVRTSRFALALPALLFLLLTSMIWASMFGIENKLHILDSVQLVPPPAGAWLPNVGLIPDPSKVATGSDKIQILGSVKLGPPPAATWLLRFGFIPDPSKEDIGSAGKTYLLDSTKVGVSPKGAWPTQVRYIPDPEYLKGLLAWSVGYQFPVTLVLFTFALLLLIWWALPSALTERFPQRGEKEAPRYSTNSQSLGLGTWLSRGLDATSVVTFLFWSAIFLAPPAFYLLAFLPSDLHWATTWQSKLTTATIWIVSSIALAVSGAVLAVIVKYGSPVLGAVLDVDTYLRASPTNATPRAKIMERYISTLRYLARYRDPDGRAYDSVVIVAHSLGMVITTDLLLYLHSNADPEVAAFGIAPGQQPAKIKLKLMSMGSPIRQLLNRFFPYLYDWVREKPDNGLRPLPPPLPCLPPPTIPSTALPDPRELGLVEWVNVYRSGDYVGRSLWLDEWYCRTTGRGSGRYPQPVHRATDGPPDTRVEMCIGAGAHTHYWDDTAPDVAEHLNSMI